jgi:tetratricopeptide (TPR) repeat protein
VAFFAPASQSPARCDKRLLFFLSLALVAAVAAVYAQAGGFGFINCDDPMYVYKNARVQAGLTLPNVIWAFTTGESNNWIPLTWLSYMLDQGLFGPGPGPEHLENACFHAGASVLLLLAFARMTGQAWRSAVLAGVFALHPLHVESVAWISERKDVLNGFFAMLALLLYARYAEAPSARRYLAMSLAFAASLLSKPMTVTLPLVLLLLDVWPLRRLDVWPLPRRTWPFGLKSLWPFLREKLPLLALALACGAVTAAVHWRAGESGFIPLAALSLSLRFAHAAVVYVDYIGKAFFPTGLAFFYAYQAPELVQALGNLALLAAITVGCALALRRAPYLMMGWLWYLVMLLPVIGLVQNGFQDMADRFMYLPLIGLSAAAIWAFGDIAADRRWANYMLAGLAAVLLLAMGIAAHKQAGYWKNSETLYNHDLAIVPPTAFIEGNLAAELMQEKRYAEAAEHFRAAVLLQPNALSLRFSLATTLERLGRLEEAAEQYVRYRQLNPDEGGAEGQTDLCFALIKLKRLDEAVAACHEALRLNPDFLQARYNLGLALALQGKNPEAAAEFTRVLSAKPDYPGARAALGKVQAQ